MKGMMTIAAGLLAGMAGVQPSTAQATLVETAEAHVHAAIGRLRIAHEEGTLASAEFNQFIVAMQTWEQAVSPFLPWACTLRSRLEVAISELEQRAQNALVAQVELDELEEQFIDAKLDLALYQLQERAMYAGASREDYLTAVNLLLERAASAKSDPQANLIRVQLTQMLTSIEQRAQGALVERAEFQGLWMALIQARYLRARQSQLERMAVSGFSRVATMRVLSQLVDRARRSAGAGPPSSCH